VDIKARNKQVKAILSNAFGKGNISVTNGKGTAWGWCNIHIKTPDPCPDKQHENSCQGYCTNGICKGNNKQMLNGWSTTRNEKWREINEKAKTLLKNISFGSFYSDDGYNTALTRMSIHIDFI